MKEFPKYRRGKDIDFDISPVTKIVKSKKEYNRGKMNQIDVDMTCLNCFQDLKPGQKDFCSPCENDLKELEDCND